MQSLSHDGSHENGSKVLIEKVCKVQVLNGIDIEYYWIRLMHIIAYSILAILVHYTQDEKNAVCQVCELEPLTLTTSRWCAIFDTVLFASNQ